MFKKTPYKPTSDVLEELSSSYKNEFVTIEEIKLSLRQRGFGILLAIFCLPLVLPIPVPPGYTTIFSIPLFLLSLQMMVRRESPWLPKWMTRRMIRRSRVESVVKTSVPFLRKIEKIIRPRYWPDDDAMIERSIGFFTFIFAMSIAVPLPLTNVPPAFGILVMALGLLARDGISVLIGKAVGLLGCGITIAVMIFGHKFVMSLVE